MDKESDMNRGYRGAPGWSKPLGAYVMNDAGAPLFELSNLICGQTDEKLNFNG